MTPVSYIYATVAQKPLAVRVTGLSEGWLSLAVEAYSVAYLYEAHESPF